jgi:hypothetical protein
MSVFNDNYIGNGNLPPGYEDTGIAHNSGGGHMGYREFEMHRKEYEWRKGSLARTPDEADIIRNSLINSGEDVNEKVYKEWKIKMGNI